jgi:ferredoxin
MPKITIAIDPETCISAANCVGVAQQFFRIGANPYVEVVGRDNETKGTIYTLEVTPEELALVEEAAESCPTRAIVVKAAADNG